MQEPRKKGKPWPKGQGCPTLTGHYPRGSRPVVWTTLREGVRGHALESLEARSSGKDTSPSPRGTLRVVLVTTAHQSACEGALAFGVF